MRNDQRYSYTTTQRATGFPWPHCPLRLDAAQIDDPAAAHIMLLEMLCLRHMVKVRDVIEAVEEAGWVYERTRGDHRIFGRPRQPGTVVVSGQVGGDVPEGTLTSICRQAGIDKAKLKRGGR